MVYANNIRVEKCFVKYSSFVYFFLLIFKNTTFYKSHVLNRSSWYRELKKNLLPTLPIILSTKILVFRKKQTRRDTNKLIRNKTELLGQKIKKNCVKENYYSYWLLLHDCCIYLHIKLLPHCKD